MKLSIETRNSNTVNATSIVFLYVKVLKIVIFVFEINSKDWEEAHYLT